MVLLAERFRHRIVVPVYVGSNPTEHPKYFLIYLTFIKFICIFAIEMPSNLRDAKQPT